MQGPTINLFLHLCGGVPKPPSSPPENPPLTTAPHRLEQDFYGSWRTRHLRHTHLPLIAGPQVFLLPLHVVTLPLRL